VVDRAALLGQRDDLGVAGDLYIRVALRRAAVGSFTTAVACKIVGRRGFVGYDKVTGGLKRLSSVSRHARR
jgi:hypothetical protein